MSKSSVTIRLLEARLHDQAEEIDRLRNVLRTFADNKLSEDNCASVELAGRRIAAMARAALANKT